MTATLIDGKLIASQIKAELKAECESLRAKGIVPGLAVVLVGDDPASVYYAESKKKLGAAVGIQVEVIRLPSSATQSEVASEISRLNASAAVHGILLELPLPAGLQKGPLLDRIAPQKDVDGVTTVNRGRLLAGEPTLVPATPLACLEVLQRSGHAVAGKRVCLIGRGETVGKPLSVLLIQRDATVTVCHSKTKDLAATARVAEIVIVAIGRAKAIGADVIPAGAVVVDAGINEVAPGAYVGDVAFDAVRDIASAITPVPGGVGTVTTALLMRNVLTALHLSASR